MRFEIEPVAIIHNDFKEKFGIPRQSGILKNNISTIVFCEKYRDENSLRGLEEYSHVWLLWIFDKNKGGRAWSPTVRPPRLGGNKRIGVFSTRSPYHPNNIGLSCVKIEAVEKNKTDGIILKVSGADLLDGTPIIDIKPYLTFSDSVPDAKCGFADEVREYEADVNFDKDFSYIDENILLDIKQMLKHDPRPSYKHKESCYYSMLYKNFDVKFTAENDKITVTDIIEIPNGSEK